MGFATKHIDHVGYAKRMKSKTDGELKFIIKDASEAISANPDNPNNGYYADEVNYASDELARRHKNPKITNWYGIRYYTGDDRLSLYVGFKTRLLPYRRACAIVRWLKSKGVDAYHDKFQIRS